VGGADQLRAGGLEYQSNELESTKSKSISLSIPASLKHLLVFEYSSYNQSVSISFNRCARNQN
jgi:hypothetical protein